MGVEMPALGACMTFHVITEGSCLLEVDGEVHALNAGDLALVPHRFTLPGSVGLRSDDVTELVAGDGALRERSVRASPGRSSRRAASAPTSTRTTRAASRRSRATS